MYINITLKGVIMFCVQCEQTIRTRQETAAHTRRGCVVKRRKPLPSGFTHRGAARAFGLGGKSAEYGIINHDVDSFAPRAFFST